MTRRGASSLRLCLLLAAALLTACQTAAPLVTPEPTSTRTAGPAATPAPRTSIGIPEEALKDVSIEAWMPWFGVDASLFESQVAAFNTSNEWGITVFAVSKSNYTVLYDSVSSAVKTDARPQVVIAFPEHALSWNASGKVVDLTRYVNDARYGLSAEEVRDIPDVFWSQDAIGGKRVAVPAERSARFLLYNESWARELGFEAPPEDPGDFRQQACRAHESKLSDNDRSNDGLGGWLVDTNATTFVSWLSAFGGGVLEGNNYRFLTPKNLSALAFIKQMYNDGCSWTAQPGADLPAAFGNRKALFATAGLEELTDYARAMGAADNSDEWTVLAFPGNGQNGLVVYGSSYVILESTPEQQLASWLFVRWLLSPDNQKKWVEVNGMFPLRTSALELLADYQKSHPQWAAAVELLPEAQMSPQLASWRKVRVMIGDGFDAMFKSNTEVGRVAEVLAIMESTSRDLSK